VARIKGDIAWQRQQGYNADWLGDEELRERCPGVTGDALGAMLAPEDGAVDPRALHDALLASAREHGVTITLGHRVDGVVIESGRARAVKCGDQNIAAGAVLVAAGAWSARLQGLPAPLTVEPIRGQMLSYDWPEGRPPAIIYGGTSYVLKRGPEALVGTTMEHAEFDASTTEEGLQIVAAKGVRIYPDLEGAEVRRQWAGLRPVTPDGHPYLGRDPRVEGLWYATGHGRNGILLAGITGELTAQMMAGDKVEYDLTPLDPGRFWQF
jgi:glycine oxidase